jgi:endonuclease YncB( thermonuclease family)
MHRHGFRKPAVRDVLLGLAVVALLAAFFNPPDPGVTSGEFGYVQRVVDGDTLVLGSVPSSKKTYANVRFC